MRKNKSEKEFEVPRELQQLLDDEKAPDQEPGQVRCPKCGEWMPDTIKTCVHCGQKLKESSYQPISDKKAGIIRLVLGAVLIAGFFIWWFVFKQ